MKSYVFQMTPNLQGRIPDNNWIFEFKGTASGGTVVAPAEDFWIAYRISGPAADGARIVVVQAPADNKRSVVINSNFTTTPVSSYMWSQIQDTVDLKMEARFCYDAVPVELTAFTASYIDGNTILHWRTAGETNNFGFEVERLEAQSEDGALSIWGKLGFVEGHATTTEPQSYTYIDGNPIAAVGKDGMVRYRLRQIDYDGSYEYSPVQAVVPAAALPAISLHQSYPNPVRIKNGFVTIPYQTVHAVPVRIEVINSLGRVVGAAFDGFTPAGFHSVSFSVTELLPGWYSYQLTSGAFIDSKRFLVTE
jgi:hypothetical protein